MLDFFDTFINPLEKELRMHSATVIGRSHGIGAYDSYKARIDAVNFALRNDDAPQVPAAHGPAPGSGTQLRRICSSEPLSFLLPCIRT